MYCLIFFLRGELPWSRIMQPKKAEEMKLKTSIEAICQDVPSEFYKLLKMCREKMPMKTMPDYDAIRQTFRALSRQQGFAEVHSRTQHCSAAALHRCTTPQRRSTIALQRSTTAPPHHSAAAP